MGVRKSSFTLPSQFKVPFLFVYLFHFFRALQMNLHGTIAMMQLARKMSKLEVFLHVSTAYAHCYMRTIKEKFYISDLHSDKNFWEMVLNSEKAKEELKIDDIDKYCNTYSCSKAMAESYISRNCQDIPVVIVRPSIVCASWKEPKPGWIDNFNGPTGKILVHKAFGSSIKEGLKLGGNK